MAQSAGNANDENGSLTTPQGVHLFVDNREVISEPASSNASLNASSHDSSYASSDDSSGASSGASSDPTSPNTDPASNSHRHKLRRWQIILIIALAVLVVALAIFAYIAYSYFNGQKTYDDIADIAFSGVDLDDADLYDNLGAIQVDWDALREINPDVVGWIYVPHTVVNYPIAHRDGDDDYYLNHNFANETAGRFGAEYGCIMLSGENAADFSDQVNIIYGHNMANGTMFDLFSRFYESDTFNENRTIYLFTPAGNYRLSSFAVDRISGSDTTIVIPNFETVEEFRAYVQKRLDDSVVTADPSTADPDTINQVFAFSTCDGANDSYRYVTFCEIAEFASFESEETSEYVERDVTADVEDSVGQRIS